MMPGPMIVGFTLVTEVWGLLVWRMGVEASRSWEVGDD